MMDWQSKFADSVPVTDCGTILTLIKLKQLLKDFHNSR